VENSDQYIRNVDMKTGVFETPYGKFRIDGGHIHDLLAEFHANKRYHGYWTGICETCGQVVSECLDGSNAILDDARECARCDRCGDGKKLRFDFVKGE
jgi:hypothetical protein